MMINNGVGALLLVPLALSPTRFGELGHVHEIAAFDARQWALLGVPLRPRRRPWPPGQSAEWFQRRGNRWRA